LRPPLFLCLDNLALRKRGFFLLGQNSPLSELGLHPFGNEDFALPSPGKPWPMPLGGPRRRSMIRHLQGPLLRPSVSPVVTLQIVPRREAQRTQRV
jgi:hypothetical protein